MKLKNHCVYVGTIILLITLIISIGCARSTADGSGSIMAGEPPVASFSALYVNNTVPSAIAFHDYSTGTPPLTYTWEFGDGATSTEQNPIHVYQFEGAYNVRLTVSNQYGSDNILKTCTTSQQGTAKPIHIAVPLSEITVPVTAVPEMRAPVFTQSDTGKTTDRFFSRTLGSVLLLSISSIIVIGLLVIAMKKRK
jgi:PKD repeat protein